MIYGYLKAFIFHNLIYSQLITECQKKEFYQEKIKDNPFQMIPYFVNYFLCVQGTHDKKKADKITAKIFDSYNKKKANYIKEETLSNSQQGNEVLHLYTNNDNKKTFSIQTGLNYLQNYEPIFQQKLFKGKSCEEQNLYFTNYFANLKFYYSKFQLDPIETLIEVVNEQVQEKNKEEQLLDDVKENIYENEIFCENILQKVFIISEFSDQAKITKIRIQLYNINKGLLQPILFSYFPKYNTEQQINTIQYQQQDQGYKINDFLKFGFSNVIDDTKFIQNFKHQNGKCVNIDENGHNQIELQLGQDKLMNCQVEITTNKFNEFCSNYQQKLKIFGFLKRFKQVNTTNRNLCSIEFFEL